MATLRSYPINLVPDPELPRGLFDPRWEDPRITAKVALEHYKRRTARGPFPAAALAPVLPRYPRAKCDARSFALTHVVELGGARVKGSGFGELHRRYTFGGGRPPVNFHAQALCFGADDRGRWFLRANVGRFDGPWGNEAALVVAFFAKDAPLGGVVWTRTLDPAGDVDVELVGVDAALAGAFDALDRADVTFYANHRGDAPADTGEDTALDDGPGDGLSDGLSDAVDVFGGG